MSRSLLDLRYTLRQLRKRPGFTAIAVATLALGIGANAAIFSVVNGVLLRPLPFPDPDRLVMLWERDLTDGAGEGPTTPGTFSDWRRDATAFGSLAAFSITTRNIAGPGEPERAVGALSVGSIFDVLDVPALLGRTFTTAEDRPGGERVVVLSHRAWQRLFGGDPAAIGRTLTLHDDAYTLIGVMPPAFRFPDAEVDFWIPSYMSDSFRDDRTQYFLRVLGRLRPETTLERARAEMETIMARLRAAHPRANRDSGVSLVPLRKEYVGDVRSRLLVLMGAIGLVLLIACANLINLLLARSAGRRREIALRGALGASRARLVRQLLTESIALAFLGGAAGLLLGAFLLDVLLGILPADLPRAQEIHLDRHVLGFTLAVSLLAGLATGILPALSDSRSASREALRESDRVSASGGRVRGGLVAAELALAVVLLAGAGLLVRSLWLLQRVDPGVRVANVLTFQVSLPASRYPEPHQRLEFFRAAVERVGAVAGVRSASIVNFLPVTGAGVGAWLNIMDRPLPEDRTPPTVRYRVIDPGYLRTMGISLVRGRPLSERDGLRAPAVLINETLAARFWPGEEPLGRQIILGPREEGSFPAAAIVGIVADVRNAGLGEETPPVVYVPHALMPHWSWFTFVVRTGTPPMSVLAAARAEVRAIDAALPIHGVRTMEEVLGESVASTRASAILLGVFAALALAMAALGVFGVLSYTVNRRFRELGIRMALGAEARSVRAMIVRQGLVWALVGIAIGLAGAWVLTRVLSGFLYGISATDPPTFAAVIVFLLAVTTLASYLPARRATRIDPVEALRHE